MSSDDHRLDAVAASRDGQPLRIVVGWDKNSSDGVALAAWLGRSMPVEVSVISTVPRSWTKSLSSKKYKKWLKAEASRYADKASAVLNEHLSPAQFGAPPFTLIDAFDEPAALMNAAQDRDADLIILGTSVKPKKARFMASPYSSELLHSSPISLGLAPKGLKLSKKGVTRVNYLFLYADRDRDSSGLRDAVRTATSISVPLRLVSMFPELPDAEEFDTFVHTVGAARDWYESSLALLDRARDEALRYAAELSPTAAENLEVETALAYGGGWDKAVDSLKWKRGDLMCLGSRPKAQGHQVFIGSRASELLRHAPAPVMIFPRLEA
ncbi:universal stress protein [Corynebacterium mayonis]|uniref:universal stress protein n=1 Tax=Corynebacterium mayonis TaxID=3062461 RepID=UPI0031404EC6